MKIKMIGVPCHPKVIMRLALFHVLFHQNPPKICILLYLECMYLAWILYNSAELTFFFLSFFSFLERALAQHVLELETELEHKAVQYCKVDENRCGGKTLLSFQSVACIFIQFPLYFDTLNKIHTNQVSWLIRIP